jgi:hypothetical protein
MHCKPIRLAALCIVLFALCTTLFFAAGAAPEIAASENTAYTDTMGETVSTQRSTMKNLTILFTVLSIVLLIATIALLVSTLLTLKHQREDHK